MIWQSITNFQFLNRNGSYSIYLWMYHQCFLQKHLRNQIKSSRFLMNMYKIGQKKCMFIQMWLSYFNDCHQCGSLGHWEKRSTGMEGTPTRYIHYQEPIQVKLTKYVLSGLMWPNYCEQLKWCYFLLNVAYDYQLLTMTYLTPLLTC